VTAAVLITSAARRLATVAQVARLASAPVYRRQRLPLHRAYPTSPQTAVAAAPSTSRVCIAASVTAVAKWASVAIVLSDKTALHAFIKRSAASVLR
jgi:hypothetical protein